MKRCGQCPIHLIIENITENKESVISSNIDEKYQISISPFAITNPFPEKHKQLRQDTE